MNLLQDLRAAMPQGMTRPIGVKPEGSKVDRMAASRRRSKRVTSTCRTARRGSASSSRSFCHFQTVVTMIRSIAFLSSSDGCRTMRIKIRCCVRRSYRSRLASFCVSMWVTPLRCPECPQRCRGSNPPAPAQPARSLRCDFRVCESRRVSQTSCGGILDCKRCEIF
jgi:hypothetical protein